MEYSVENCVAHIHKTVDLLYQLEQWENMAFVKALSLGLQGSKREARYEGAKDENIRKYLQSAAYDLFEEEIYPKSIPTQFPAVNGIESFLSEYRRGLWDMYWKLHEAANIFVAPLCLRDLACPLYDRASCIKDAIVDINRRIKRWSDAKQYGTPYHDIMIYETSEWNKHDSYEKKEESMGYKY